MKTDKTEKTELKETLLEQANGGYESPTVPDDETNEYKMKKEELIESPR